MTDKNKRYAVKRVHEQTGSVEWLIIDDDGRRYWSSDREARELLFTRPNLRKFDRYADWRYFIVTLGEKSKSGVRVVLDPHNYVLFDMDRNDLYVLTPQSNQFEMTFVGSSLNGVINYLRNKKP